MRPISLKVEGFSCFRDAQQVLDFSTLSLFAISGPTGAGKSSVLDAMTFALYGYVPRLGKQGVSDVISLGRDRMTVSLEFAIGDRRFRVGRELRRKKPGSVILEELINGTETLLADKVREVDERIAALTGLRYETFIQTVLLPQGEFDRFLHSDPGERGKILRELLKLDMYERMRLRADQDSRQGQQQIKLLRERLEQDYADATPEQLGAARIRLTDASDGEGLARGASEMAVQVLQDVLARLTQSKELATNRGRLGQLSERANRMTEDRVRLDNARRAAPVVPRLDEGVGSEGRVVASQRELDDARVAFTAAQGEANRLHAAHEQTRQETAVIPGVRARIQALDELRGVSERRAQLIGEITSATNALDAIARDEKQIALEVRRADKEKEDAERGLAQARDTRDGIGYDAKRHTALEPIVAHAVRGSELHRQLASAKRQATSAVAKANEADAASKQATAEVEQYKTALARARDNVGKAESALQDARNANHAAALRPTLKTGELCPVCEVVVKKVPRRLRAPELEDREHAVEQAKRAASKATSTLEDSRDAAARAASQAGERREAAEERSAEVKRVEKEIAIVSKKLAGVVTAKQVGSLSSEICEALSDEASRWAQLKREFDLATDRVNRAASALQDALHTQKQSNTTSEHLASRKRDVNVRISQLLEEESSVTARIKAVTDNPNPSDEREKLAKRVSALDSAERKADEALQEARRSVEAASARIDVVERTVRERQDEAAVVSAAIIEALREAGFSDSNAARAAALTLDDQRRLANAIHDYDVERLQVESRIGDLERLLGGRYVSEEDRASADRKSQDARRAYEVAAESLARARQDVERLSVQVERALELRRGLATLESGLKLSEQLAKDLKNDGFQRYLLEEAFRSLVEGASIRMKQWTNRYSLEWDDGAFYAIDHDNGGERRRAETLSGGETFLASLSMALQLSEEVLRTAGAVQIDSIFIDEGFGTLDVETLDTVIEAIESLRVGGRMVGIITHIRDLTERLPGCIEIEKGQGESRWTVARSG